MMGAAKLLTIGLAGGLLLAACGSRQSTDSPRPPSEGPPIGNFVRPRATYELRCPAAQITIREVGSQNYAAQGCGAEAVYVCVGSMGMYACRRDGAIRGTLPAAEPVLPATRLVAKEGAPVGTIIVPRAAFDLKCPAESLAIYQLADNTYLARGCNAERIYACAGAMGMYQCEAN